jgi:acyl transferase domain-containing protein/acyl carrier protein
MGQNTHEKTPLSPLKQALVAIDELQKKLTKSETAQKELIAIVGMACRLPGQVESPREFWEFLQRGGDGINRNPAERWPVADLVDADPAAPGKTLTLCAGLIKDYDRMDAGFFGIAPREAETMDPQQRLALELSWSAIQDAGYSAAQLENSNTGVFLGVGATEYFRLCLESGNRDAGFFITGNTQNVIGGRVAYLLGLHGPCVAIETACSSSLVAVHFAVQALRRGECDAALAGGVNLLVDPQIFVSLSKAGMLSTDGSCKTFDKDANGYVRGEGGGVLMLKTLSRALADGDHIHAVIRGSAVNQDGRSSSLTAPNGPAQQAVIKKALDNAGVKPADVDYVETHGTGTPLGDPIEVGALKAVYGKQRNKPLVLGALKSNIGHLEAASGVASMIKVVLSLQHGQVPKNIHFNELNPHIDLDGANISIAAETTPLRDETSGSGKALIAAVSSFGFSGTNAHIILEQAPAAAQPPAAQDTPQQTVCTLSAKSEEALQSLARRYSQFLREQSPSVTDFCASLNTGRDHYRFRKGLAVENRNDLIAQLNSLSSKDGLAVQVANETMNKRPRIGFMFTGQGSQYAGMALDLYENEPVFKETLDRCASLLAMHLDRPLFSVLWGDAAKLIDETRFTQPALFSVEYALAMLWKSWGVEPVAVMGHSVGEYVAACVAGLFSLEDGLRLISHRGKLMQALPMGGGMLVVMEDAELVARRIEGQQDKLSIAAINAPMQTVLSGALDALKTLSDACSKEGVRTVALAVSHAFHSPLMNTIVEPFHELASTVDYQQPQHTVISCLTGVEGDERMGTADYWAEHITAPVNFAGGVRELCKHADLVLEIGPKTTLISLSRQCAEDNKVHWVASLREGKKDTSSLYTALLDLYEHGATIDWPGVHARMPWCKLPLPVYPYQRQRYWVTGNSNSQQVAPALNYTSTAGTAVLNPLLGQRLVLPLLKETCYQTVLSTHVPAYLEHHRLFDIVIVPGASHVAMVLTAIRDRFNTQACVLNDVVFYQPIAIADNANKAVQLMLKPTANKLYEFKIVSLDADEDVYQENAWTTHATGIFSLGGEPSLSALPVDTASATTTWPLQETGEDFYQRIWDGGYTLGNAFRWVGDRWSQGNETLHRMVLPELPDGALDYQIHPGLLDSCFQAFGSSAGLQVGEDDIYIPFSVGRMHFYAQPGASGLWCYSRPRREEGPGAAQRYVGDLTLFDDSGAKVFEIEGLELRKSSQKLLKQGLQGSLDSHKNGGTFYQAQWALSQAGSLKIVDDAGALWVVLCAEDSLDDALSNALHAQGKRWVTVHRGELYANPSQGRYVVRPDSAEDFVYLFEALSAQPIAGILDLRAHALAFDPAAATCELQARIMEASAELIALVQAIARHFENKFPRLLVATNRAQAVELDNLNILQNALWGLGRVMAVELPQMQSVFVDVSNEGGAFDIDNAALLVRELNVDALDKMRVLRGERRYAQRLGRAEMRGTQMDNPIRADKTYLVTGAMGGLGLELILLLLKQGVRHLALLIRREPSEEQKQYLDALTQSGVKLSLFMTDISSQAQVNAAIVRIKNEMPTLGGIFHLAGVIDDQFIEQASMVSYEKVFAPKVAGGWNLHQATRDIDLDFFVTYSSIASMFGTPGQGNYAVANGFLDALMLHRKALGLSAMSINWGPWADVGMAARVVSKGANKMDQVGLRSFDVDSGMSAMGALLQQPLASVGVIKIDWPLFLQKFPGAAIAPLFQAYREEFLGDKNVRGGLLAQLQMVPVGERMELLTSQVAGILVDILRLPSQDYVTLDQGFFDAGMDSLMSLEFRQRLSMEYDISLPPTVAFNYPTVGELIGYLSWDVLDIEFDDASPPPLTGFAGTDLSEDLSEEDLAVLLEQQLG